MTYNECLFFLQYDRNATIPSDVWHCALPNINDNGIKRKPFDIKLFIVLNETLDDIVIDLYRNKVSSILNLEQSECFCDSQAKNRNS